MIGEIITAVLSRCRSSLYSNVIVYTGTRTRQHGAARGGVYIQLPVHTFKFIYENEYNHRIMYMYIEELPYMYQC